MNEKKIEHLENMIEIAMKLIKELDERLKILEKRVPIKNPLLK